MENSIHEQLLENAVITNMEVARGLRALCERDDFFEVLRASEPQQPEGPLVKPPLGGDGGKQAVGKNPTPSIDNTPEWARSIYDVLALFSEITRSVSTILGILK